MRNTTPAILILAATCCLFFTKTAQAQNTLTYATVDYDSDTNTIYGYTYTETDYSASVYYNKTHVTAKLRDASDTQLAIGTKENYNARAELYLQAPGNGNPPYKIQSGHMVFAAYYVTNFYDYYTRMYRSGWLDYYYYTYYAEGPGGPVVNIPLTFTFGGRRPETVITSPNRFLGQLLSYLFPVSGGVFFNTATIYDRTVNFTPGPGQNADISMGGSAYANEVCGSQPPDYPETFTLRVDFTLPDDGTLAPNRCTARPLGIPDHDYEVFESTITCVMDSSFNKKGHLEVNVRRRCCLAQNINPSISVGIGCNYGTGACDTKGRVKIRC